jgi:hypothetical protein
MPLYYLIIASVPLFLLLLPVMSPAAAASGGGDATTSAAVVGTSKQQLQRVDDQGVDGPFSAPEVLSIAGEQQQEQQQDEEEAMEQEVIVEKQQLHATTSCDIHNNEPLHGQFVKQLSIEMPFILLVNNIILGEKEFNEENLK